MNYKIKSCNCGNLFDVENKKHTIIQDEILSAEEGFWNDQIKAKNIMQELEDCRGEVESFENLEAEVNELREICEIVNTEKEWEDIKKQLKILKKEVEKLDFITLFDGEYDTNSAIITINTGAGGVDAQDWSEMLLRMFIKWAESHKFKVTVLDRVDGGEAGIKNATIEIVGRWVYGYMRSESGVHRMVRLSPFNSDNLRQTSFARVDVMPLIEDVKEFEIKLDDLRVDTYRASGAGGQHVNTTDSAVRITYIPSGLTAQCQSERSQAQNKENAMKMLKAKLYKLFIEEQANKKKELRGEMKEAGWGNQIRSYILHPYKMVKDHRTKHESVQVDNILNGEIDEFMIAFLRMK
jgi:peptide chain release factor 2